MEISSLDSGSVTAMALPQPTADCRGADSFLSGTPGSWPGSSGLDRADSEGALSPEQRLLMDRARRADHSQRGVREMTKHLPESDEELDEVFAHLIRRRDRDPFCVLWCANLALGRQVDSRHLVDGLFLIPFLQASLHHLDQFHGDVDRHGLAMIRDKAFSLRTGTISLLLVVSWSLRQKDGEIPPEVFSHLRKLAREPIKKWKEEREALLLFCGLLNLIDDSRVSELLEHQDFPATESNRLAGAKAVAEFQRKPILDYLPDRISARVVSGGTVKYDARKPGRNDPCHCGSEKKYKKCCETQDRQQELDSPAAPGLVSRENPGATALTANEIYVLTPQQAFELEFQQIAPHLRRPLLVRLWVCQEFDRVAEHCRSLPEDVEEDVRSIIGGMYHSSLLMGQMSFARALAASCPWLGGELDLANCLVLGKESGEILDRLELEARRSIEQERPSDTVLMAISLLNSGRYPALGVLLARGVIASNRAKLGEPVVKAVRVVLDANQWNPYDPAEDILDLVDRAEDDERETEEAVAKVKSEATAELETKRDEIRRLQWELRRTQDSLKTHRQSQEQEAEVQGLTAHSVPETTPSQPQPVSGKRLREVRELRERCARLQNELRQRHDERNKMRRSLHEAQETLSRKAGDRSGHASSSLSDEEEEELLLDHSVLPNWPARFPVWPPEVRAHRKIPDSVWRTALQLTGRLAAGDPGAVHGVKLLKGLNGIYRQRLAGSWRLLFELDDHELRVVDLIPRRDLIPWARARASR